MKCAFIEEHGSLGSVQVNSIDPKSLPEDRILIQMHYAALNHLDLFVTQGWPGLKLEFPHILGSDGSGTILEIGSQCQTDLKVGDQVLIDPTIGWLDGKMPFSEFPLLILASLNPDNK